MRDGDVVWVLEAYGDHGLLEWMMFHPSRSAARAWRVENSKNCKECGLWLVIAKYVRVKGGK